MSAKFSARCWAQISSSALRHNLNVTRRLIGPGVRIMGVVKANAYGHGLVPVAKILAAAGIHTLGVAQVAEGVQLREAGCDLPILVLSPALPEEYEASLTGDLALTISSLEEARRLNEVARKMGTEATIHFNIDTGMGRIGCWHEEAAAVLAQIRKLPKVEVVGLCSHFAAADEDEVMTRRQWKALAPFLSEEDFILHIANSAGVMGQRGYEADTVRCGLMLYGVSPFAAQQKLLKPVMTWKSRITLLRQVPKGRTVSYGATYRLPKVQRLATVAVGYGDGYFRALSNRGFVLVGGKRCPIRGRVTMDQIVVDVSRVPQARVGTEVVLMGPQGHDHIHAAELAEWAGTISYEILTNVGVRVSRVYSGT